MSADEDTELRDLVAQTLESNGVLGKIRAQLRASVFLALEEQESVQNKTPFQNQELKKFNSTREGRLVTALVKEFLEYFNLEFTQAVFDPETGFGDHYEGRNSVARDLDIIESDGSKKAPLLSEVVKRLSGNRDARGRLGSDSQDLESFIQVPKDLSTKHVSEARKKFEQYDTDKNGTIDRDELRALFCDMFPNFHRNMLDRYVNDEFRAADRDFSNTIDFDEFLDMYKRLFVLCKSVVSHDVSDITLNSPRRMSDLNPGSKIPAPLKKQTSSGLTSTINSTVESKNKKNLESTAAAKLEPLSKLTLGDLKDSSVRDSFEDDPFFDDPVPVNKETRSFPGTRGSHDNKRSSSPRTTSPRSQIPVKSPTFGVSGDKNREKDDKGSISKGSGGSGGMSSLAGLPSLTNPEPQKSPKSPDLEKDIKAIDQRIADLGFDVPEDDYEDDFNSSDVSPFGITPRSDKNIKSIDEDIDEDIEEDLSVAEDLLKSDNSAHDDLTTDRTISPTEQSAAFDYMEDVLSP